MANAVGSYFEDREKPVWPKEVETLLNTYKKRKYVHLEKPLDPNKNYLGSDTRRYPWTDRYDYDFYYDTVNRQIHGVVYFGEALQGPKNCTHGGGIASILDAIQGTTLWCSEIDAVTLNLNVNYRKFVPSKTFLQVTTSIMKIDERKINLRSELRSLDGDIVYAEGNSLWFRFSRKRGCLDLNDYGFHFKKFTKVRGKLHVKTPVRQTKK